MSQFSRQSGRRFVVAWGSECEATHKDIRDQQSNLEEADTMMILHVADTSSDGAMESQVHSYDTDVFGLAVSP